MGGKGSGGWRVGSGRKPKAGSVAAFAGAPRVVSSRDVGDVSPIPPTDLPADQKAFWHAYAAMAIEKCTLTPHTVAGFRLLTELAARKDRTARMLVITEDLVSGEDGAPHLATLLQLGRLHALLAQRVEGLLGRFGLAPFGRAEEAVPRRKAAPNPFEQLSGVPERGER